MLIVDGILISQFVKDHRGKKFGKLTVVEFHKIEKGKTFWYCACECGNFVSVKTNNFVSGITKSCGCLISEIQKKENCKSGYTRTPEGTAWKHMLKRCYDKNHQYFRHYGGRGICVCERYRNSFDAFFQDIGERPGKVVKGKRSRYSLDRIQNNLNYSCGRCSECLEKSWPMNIKWSTMEEQARNMRSNHLVTYKGVTKPLIEWTEKFGLRYDSVLMRINNSGWSIEDALEKSLTRNKRGLLTCQGKSFSIREWAEELGLSYHSLWNRLKTKTIEEIVKNSLDK